MLDIDRSYTGDLTPTKTYAARCWTWRPILTTAAHEESGYLGELTIELLHAAPRSGKVESDTYALSELPPLRGLMGRRFELEHLGGELVGQVYEVILGPLGRCECDAGGYKSKSPAASLGCKHRDSISALIAAGLLDDHEPAGSDVERSGLAFHDQPGEPPVSETAALPASTWTPHHGPDLDAF